MKQENIEKPKKNIYHKEEKSQKQKPRYQKMVTTVLYLALFIIVGYTFWEFWHVGESVSPEIYDKTVDLFLGLLGITGSLKISETIMDGVKGSFQYKYGNPDNIEVDPNEPSLGVDDRGGE